MPSGVHSDIHAWWLAQLIHLGFCCWVRLPTQHRRRLWRQGPWGPRGSLAHTRWPSRAHTLGPCWSPSDRQLSTLLEAFAARTCQQPNRHVLSQPPTANFQYQSETRSRTWGRPLHHPVSFLKSKPSLPRNPKLHIDPLRSWTPSSWKMGFSSSCSQKSVRQGFSKRKWQSSLLSSRMVSVISRSASRRCCLNSSSSSAL